MDTDYVYTEESATAQKNGFEERNLRVLKEILLSRIIRDFETKSCAMGKIFPRRAAF